MSICRVLPALGAVALWGVMGVNRAYSGAAALRLTSPVGGEKWAAGSRHFVTWEAGPAAARLEFSVDGGRIWTPVGEAKDGRYSWTVPAQPARRCRVRLVAPDPERVLATSKPFAVIPEQAVPEYAWTQVNSKAAFAPRDGAGALTFAGKMWLLGGWNPGDRQHFPRICNNEVWSSKDGADWSLVRSNTFLDGTFDPNRDWEGRHTAGYVIHRNRMWIVGGDVNQGHYQPDVWNSADGKNWTHANPGRPVP